MVRPGFVFAGFAVLAGAAFLGAFVALADHDDKRPSAVETGEYASADACKKCHFKDHKEWKKTKHAAAFETLPAKYKADATCLPCHTTGHGQPGGFVSLDKSPKLVGVQCEMCHGPGAAHAKYMEENEEKIDEESIAAEGRRLIGGQRGKQVCWRCHLDQTHGSHPEFEK